MAKTNRNRSQPLRCCHHRIEEREATHLLRKFTLAATLPNIAVRGGFSRHVLCDTILGLTLPNIPPTASAVGCDAGSLWPLPPRRLVTIHQSVSLTVCLPHHQSGYLTHEVSMLSLGIWELIFGAIINLKGEISISK
jgi:hypothetical protein